ncbi:MAG: hypothetical protein WAL71_18515 [Terriglobales bacterium]|jgi:hypothetical protein
MAEATANIRIEVLPAVPPYVPYRSFRNFIDSLKQGIPGRIDRSVMASMSGAIQSQLTAALRYMGLIKPTGQPSDTLPRLVNSEGPERIKIMREIVTTSYKFLFDGFDVKTATPRMLEEQFSAMGASGGTLSKCMNFFLAAAKEGGIETSPHLKPQRGPRQARTRQRVSRIADAGIEGQSPVIITEGEGEVSWAQMLLSKFPSFDPSWPDEVKVKWFDGFHRLMRQGSEVKQS